MTKTVEFKYDVGDEVFYPDAEKYIIKIGLIENRFRTLDNKNCYSIKDVFLAYDENEISQDEESCFSLSVEYFRNRKQEIRDRIMREVTHIS